MSLISCGGSNVICVPGQEGCGVMLLLSILALVIVYPLPYFIL
jgi:hypothetical protein